VRLAARGHQVAVYCRERPREPVYRGVRLLYLPTIRHKYFDTMAHTFLSTLHLLAHRADAALYCNGANAVFTLTPRLAGMPVALNVDGLERKRKKWNRAAKAWYLISEWLATVFPSVVVTDARAIQEYYRRRYGKASAFIPYGAETGKVESTAALAALGLEARPLLPLRQPPRTGKPSPRGPPGVRAGEDRHEAGVDRRCAVRAGLHPAGARHRGPARGHAGRHLRPGIP